MAYNSFRNQSYEYYSKAADLERRVADLKRAGRPEDQAEIDRLRKDVRFYRRLAQESANKQTEVDRARSTYGPASVRVEKPPSYFGLGEMDERIRRSPPADPRWHSG